ncbi:two-component sensor histidine kinase [Psychromonas sp. psych-6C06]|uniref:ATP-binding protein n=1 Tax=Psychromonas sp. psych-6C06 TaxID=2058089 RepID=UPI000C34709A|nr:ATP-binding protein [Psychromonas sp. psych-6C06]PKF63699.1 two-component sensor histidine kinase [Psychromonas sp. psych-6C06]
MGYFRLLFRSLVSRMLLLTIVSVIAAQTISSFFWVQQFSESEQKSVIINAQHLAEGALSTISFFKGLPLKYRHLVLEQLRGMGGSRFFVSLNSEKIDINPIKDSELKTKVIQTVHDVLTSGLSTNKSLEIEFSSPDDLHVLKNDILLKDLPPSWGAYSLIIPTAKPPILVLQIEIEEGEWLYLAAILPPPYLLSNNQLISAQQVLTLLFTTFLLLLFIYLLFHRQTKPLQNLANAVSEMSIDLDQAPLKEQGALEIVAATRAFNRMQQKLQRYIQDRELLFRSISHDLKTPITRLRLRAELLDDEQQTVRFNQDLDDLEMLVKGALQSVKETDIHENIQEVDIIKLLLQISENRSDQIYIAEKHVYPYRGKPLALKRCLSNLIENGVKYGQHVEVMVVDNAEELQIIIQDNGPGIPCNELETIFQPYKRLHNDSQGHGLGLGIARNIIHAHNGDLHLINRKEGGLEVLISLPRIYKNQL